MKKIITLLVLVFMASDCNQQQAQSIKENEPTKKQSNYRLIVVYNKNISIEQAKNEIEMAGMKVLNVYQGISKSSGQPTLLISSSLNRTETNALLKKNKDISSFTFDGVISIEPDPTKPQ